MPKESDEERRARRAAMTLEQRVEEIEQRLDSVVRLTLSASTVGRDIARNIRNMLDELFDELDATD
jgi:BMFP domain-containing protein YqiC